MNQGLRGMFLLLLSCGAAAEDELQAVPAPPVIPAAVQSGETLEPEITIVESDKNTFYEYRVNGNLYMVKVQPVAGPAYYLFDLDGDGEMDVRRNEPGDNNIPQWVLFSW
jgi:hypothetical protein